MAFYLASWLLELYLVVLTFFLAYYLHFKFVSSRYWKKRNVPHLPPIFILGNLWRSTVSESISLTVEKFYEEWKNEKIVGFWNFFHRPALLVCDLDLIKNVLTRDFNYFRDRGLEADFENDPLAGHLFNLGGAKWRNMRVKLTPTFTSGKMKMMFPTMVECGEELQKHLREVTERSPEIEVKDILARFTTDIISSCAFGIQTNSLKNPNSEFREYGRRIFTPSISGSLKRAFINSFPSLFKALKIRLTPKEVSDFFLGAVRDTMEYREKNKVKRNDFMELLIQLKNKGKLEDADEGVDKSMEFSFNDAAAQAFVFFLAGFETSSTTLTYALYELALNPEIQEILGKEIDKVFGSEEKEITYDAVNEMQYLDCVVQETLRKYPPVPLLLRKCNKEYKIPELGVVVPEKVRIMISVLGIQRDPKYYPDPDRFDPGRFSPEEREKRHHFAFLPFGEGPRNCIGNRFGILQTKVGLVSILRKFRVEVGQKTPIPIVFDKRSFVLAPEFGMNLKFTKKVYGH